MSIDHKEKKKKNEPDKVSGIHCNGVRNSEKLLCGIPDTCWHSSSVTSRFLTSMIEVTQVTAGAARPRLKLEDSHHQDRQWDYNLKNRIRKYDNLGEVLQLMRRVVSVLS